MPRPRTHDDRTGRVFPDHLITYAKKYRASRPLAAACGLGSAGVRPLLREVRRWHWVGERWRLAVTTGCAGVLDATPHARGRVPARHAPSAVGDAHDAPCCAVWQARAAAAPWRAPPGGLGAPPRRARGLWTPPVVCVLRRAAVWGALEALGARAPLHPDHRRHAHQRHVFCPRSHTA